MRAEESAERTLPPIRRMRGWRLYAEDGRRYLDLRLLDGRGFLGSKGRFAGTRAKNAIDMGVLKEAPSREPERLRKTLERSLTNLSAFLFFRNEERALAALSRILGQKLEREDLYDPLRRDTRAPSAYAPAAVHRFLLGEAETPSLESFPIRLIPPPCPEPFGPSILGFQDAHTAESIQDDELPPILPLVANRAWADFQGSIHPQEGGRRARSGEGAPPYTERHWSRADRRLSPFFDRRGPYLYAKCAEPQWPEFRLMALAGGCVLTPDWRLPSIVPGEFDDGELKNLAEALEL